MTLEDFLFLDIYTCEVKRHNTGNKIRCQEATCGFTYCCAIERGCVVSKVVFGTKLTLQDIRLNGHGRSKVAILLQAPRTCGCALGSATPFYHIEGCVHSSDRCCRL